MITEVTRKNIFDAIQIEKIKWYGNMDETEFLSRIYKLSELPSYDSRFPGAEGDIWQHRVNNDDWEENWVFTDRRFSLFTGDEEIFLRFLCEMLHPIVRSDESEVSKLKQLFNQNLSIDGYEIIEVSRISNKPIFAGRKKIEGIPIGIGIIKRQEVYNAEYLSQQINRITSSLDHDPDLAIGTSKELVETCCKTILQERNVPFDRKWDLSQLVKETYKQLKLTPDDIPDSAKASDTIKRLLSNLATVTQGISELRNSYGTGHGKAGKAKGLASRHAKLAAGAATTLAIFLFETHKHLNE